jgi:predicted DNA-binding transcriptional regulator AlpA
MNQIFLTRADLKQRGITISNTTMLRREAQGEFPKRRYLTPRTVIWNCAEIDEFLASLFENCESGQKSQFDAG